METLVKSDHYAYRTYQGVPHQEYLTQDTFWQAHHSIYYRAVEDMKCRDPKSAQCFETRHCMNLYFHDHCTNQAYLTEDHDFQKAHLHEIPYPGY